MEKYGWVVLLFSKGISKDLFMREDIKVTVVGATGGLKKWPPIDYTISTVAGMAINK